MALSNKAFRTPLRAISRTHSPLSRLTTPIPSLQNAHLRPPLPAPPHHTFHTSQTLNSALFNLGGLSTSRENQFLSKEKGRPRTEFSPHLELIRSSEVDTQRRPSSNPSKPTPTPGAVNPKPTSSYDTAGLDPDFAKGTVANSKNGRDALRAQIATLEGKVKEIERDLKKQLIQRGWLIVALICCSTILSILNTDYIQKSSSLGGEKHGTQQKSEQANQSGGEEISGWSKPQDVGHTEQLHIDPESGTWRRSLSKLFWTGAT